MSHGEHFIVPFNFFMIAANVVLWAVAMPLWTTLAIAVPVAIFLCWIGRDKYGGMQIVLLLAPAWMAGTMFLHASIENARETGGEIAIGLVALKFIGTVLGFALVLFAALSVVAGIMIGWEYARDRWLSRPSIRGSDD